MQVGITSLTPMIGALAGGPWLRVVRFGTMHSTSTAVAHFKELRLKTLNLRFTLGLQRKYGERNPASVETEHTVTGRTSF
jgi:hypothetical protein